MNQRYCNGMVHVIKQGDNLYQLSRMYRVPLALILRANPYVDVYNLQPGQEICIPIARPYPGMPRMETAGMQNESRREERQTEERQPEEDDRESAENDRESADNNRDVNTNTAPMESEETKEELMTYVSDGTKGVGQILKECGADWSDFVEKNDLDKIIIAADVVLYLPKKV